MNEQEQIVSIKEFANDSREGYKITTDHNLYEISIASGQCCCEEYGYMVTDCDISEFIGAGIKSVECVDGEYAKRLIEFADSKEVEVESCCFLVVETDKGTLDFAIYNMHNGFYEHRIYITKTSLADTTISQLSAGDWL